MGLHKTPDLDSARVDKMDETIRKLREQIAHLRSYTNTDTGMLELRLEALVLQAKQQHNKERDNGK